MRRGNATQNAAQRTVPKRAPATSTAANGSSKKVLLGEGTDRLVATTAAAAAIETYNWLGMLLPAMLQMLRLFLLPSV